MMVHPPAIDLRLLEDSKLIGLQGTSIGSRGPHVRRIPYKSGQFFLGLFVCCKKTPCKKHTR
jgi:hypothetical protein